MLKILDKGKFIHPSPTPKPSKMYEKYQIGVEAVKFWKVNSNSKHFFIYRNQELCLGSMGLNYRHQRIATIPQQSLYACFLTN